MVPNCDFESHTFDPFSINEDLEENEQDPDVNYYHDQIPSLQTEYYYPNEAKELLQKHRPSSFSVLHLNIRSMKKKL